MSKHDYSDIRVPINEDSVSIKRDNSKCILCGICKSTCKIMQGVNSYYDLKNTNDNAICIDCGQCTLVCPTNAITEVKDYYKIRNIIKEKNKIIVFQTAPSVRVGLGEEFGLEPGAFVEGKMVAALRKIGADYVFDTTFGADLTIMEEANELVKRIENKANLPLFTSCCPAWAKFVETFYPEYIPNLSSTKSPIMMQGAMIKTYFANIKKINPKDIVSIAVTPCTAKKQEIVREEMNSIAKYYDNNNLKDVDYVITTRELAQLLKEENIDFNGLENEKYDEILKKGSGAGLIFGNTGGVTEAALRTAYHILTNKDPDELLLEYYPVRGLNGIKETTIKINDIELKIAVVTGTGNARKLLKQIEENNLHYDFIEVMACIGGCIAGGGQPKTEIPLPNSIKEKRINSLYSNEKKLKLRNSYENPDIIKIYQDFLDKPLSDISKMLLHTTYNDKSSNLTKNNVLN